MSRLRLRRAGHSPEHGRVVIEISADGAGSVLTLTQEMPEQFAPYAGRTQQRWTVMLGNLAKVLDQRTETRPGYGTLRAVLVLHLRRHYFLSAD